MAEIPIAAEAGRPVGSAQSRRLRSAGRVPAVVYGHGVDPMPVAVDAKDLRAALTTDAGLNALLALKVDGSTHLTMAKVVQRHPVRGTVAHVDFQIVRRDEVVTAEVPIVLVGEAVLIHRDDGHVDHQLFNIAVDAIPGRIPNIVEVDISGLTIGQTIRVAELGLPGGVTTEVDPEAPVVVGQAPQVSEADLVPEGEEAVAEEGAEAAVEGEGEAAGEAAGEGAASGGEGGKTEGEQGGEG
ncbi:MAG TPA: 50S ribosomal protein L25 [Acidimicrobiales bacterium]|jgi:large subunit ribosomal protein L25